MGEEDLPAERAKHNVIQTPVMGGGQEGKRMRGRGGVLQTVEERWRE